MDVLGNYKSVVSARSIDKEILKHSQDGGIITTLFAYALEEGIIDGAIVAGPGSAPWKPEPVVATTKAELLAAAGTRYNISPNLCLIKEVTRSYGLDKVGIVGTPCQMQAVRKAQLYPIGLRDGGVGRGISPRPQPQTGRARFPSIRLSRVSQSARTGFPLVALQTQCLKIQQEGRLFVAGEAMNGFDVVRFRGLRLHTSSALTASMPVAKQRKSLEVHTPLSLPLK